MGLMIAAGSTGSALPIYRTGALAIAHMHCAWIWSSLQE